MFAGTDWAPTAPSTSPRRVPPETLRVRFRCAAPSPYRQTSSVGHVEPDHRDLDTPTPSQGLSERPHRQFFATSMQPATFRGRFLGITGELRGLGAVMTRELAEDVSEFERRRVEELLARTPRL